MSRELGEYDETVEPNFGGNLGSLCVSYFTQSALPSPGKDGFGESEKAARGLKGSHSEFPSLPESQGG